MFKICKSKEAGSMTLTYLLNGAEFFLRS